MIKFKTKKFENTRDFKLTGLENLIIPKKNGFLLYIVGSVGSGKTILCMNLLKDFYKNVFDDIYIYSKSYHTIPKQFNLDNFNVRNSLDLFDDDLDVIKFNYLHGESKNKKFNNLLIFDDLIQQLRNNTLFNELTLNRSHSNVSIMCLSQKYNKIPPTLRDNISHLILFPTSEANLKLVYDDLPHYKGLNSFTQFKEKIHYIFDNSKFVYLDYINKKIYNGFHNEEFFY